jgi:hypothetical protein
MRYLLWGANRNWGQGFMKLERGKVTLLSTQIREGDNGNGFNAIIFCAVNIF